MSSSDSAFAEWVQDAREADIVDAAMRRGAQLRRLGAELAGPCPVCGGREDKLSIHPGKRVFLCRQHGGGDVIALVQHLDGSEFAPACEAINGRPPPGRSTTETPAERATRERRLAERMAAASDAETKRAASEAHFREAERKRAYEIFQERQPLAGSVAERYLRQRGITHIQGLRLWAAQQLTFWVYSQPQKLFIRAGAFPAMLAAIVDGSGRFLALHITYLDPVTARKAEPVHPETGEIQKAKKIRGPQKGGVIRLAGPVDAAKGKIAEGIENTLTPREEMLREGRDVGCVAWWCGVSLDNIGGGALGDTIPHPAGLKRPDAAGRMRLVKVKSAVPDPDKPGVVLPPSMTDVTWLADADGDVVNVGLTLRRAGRRNQMPGRTQHVAWPKLGSDFNDMRMEQLRHG